jgi:hypothetical protein
MNIKYVVAKRAFTYGIDEIIESLSETLGVPKDKVRIEDVLGMIDEWAYEDLRSPISRHDLSLTYLDADGNEINEDQIEE